MPPTTARPSRCKSATAHGVKAYIRTYCFPNDSPNAQYQLFDLPAKGTSGAIKLHGKNFCFDAGTNPSNNVDMKVWTCYNGLFQQTWTYSNANTLSLTNSG